MQYRVHTLSPPPASPILPPACLQFDFIEYSVVVKLTPDELGEPPSSMRVVSALCDFEYGAMSGSAGCFLSRLHHQSVAPRSERSHIKLVFFFRKGTRKATRLRPAPISRPTLKPAQLLRCGDCDLRRHESCGECGSCKAGGILSDANQSEDLCVRRPWSSKRSANHIASLREAFECPSHTVLATDRGGEDITVSCYPLDHFPTISRSL